MSFKEINCEGNSVPIKAFDLDTITGNPAICMIAKRGSGKSYLCRALLKNFSNIPGGTIIAKTDKMNCFYGKFFPDLYVHYEYKTELIDKILYRQELMIEKCKKKYKEGKFCDPRAFILMDDCLSSKGTWAKDRPILELLFNGRHYQIMYILTMQYPLGISPELRGNFDYIFLLGEDFINNQKKLYEHYAGMFPDFKSFQQIFIEITSDYGAMVIVNKGSKSNFLDKVFWYKAPENENKKIDICSPQFNAMHKKNYNKNWKTVKPFNINTYCENRKKSKISVNKLEIE